MDTQTFTLTFGNCAENHKSMEIIGNQLDSGLELNDLHIAKQWFDDKGIQTELINLKDNLSEELRDSAEGDAYLLIARSGVNAIVNCNDLYNEQDVLPKDKKVFMYGRVVNKKARHNLCFSDYDQEPDYENKKGTVVNFNRVPLTRAIRETIPTIIPNNNKVVNLQCEGNYYYDIKTTYISYHGDTERQIVIAVRLGADFPLFYQWFKKGAEVGTRFETILHHGYIYFMSYKAVGYDWKHSSKLTLRHAAGSKKVLFNK